MDGADDGGVAGAAAEGIFEGNFDVVFAGVGVLVEEGGGGHDEAGDAEAALHRAMPDKFGLKRVEGGLEIRDWRLITERRGRILDFGF